MIYSKSATYADMHAFPGKALGIWAIVMAFLVPVVGLGLGIVATYQSRRAGVRNRCAIAAMIVGAAFSIAAGITSIAIWGG